MKRVHQSFRCQHKWQRSLFAAILTLTAIATFSFAAPYGPDGKEAHYRQPDGSTVKVRVFGDEFYAVAETEEGYTVVYDENKVLRFGQLSPDGEKILPSALRASNKPDDAKLYNMGIKKGIRKNAQGRKNAVARGLARMRADKKGRITPESVQYYEQIQQERNEDAFFAQSIEEEPPPPPPSFAPPSETRIGEYVGLTILVDFPDQPGTIPQSEIDDYCNKPGYNGYSNGGSIYDYFYTQSNGRLRYNNIVTAYVRVSQPKTYYDDNVDGTWGNSKAQDLVVEVLDILMAQGFDFTQLSVNASGNIYSLNIFYAGTVASGWSTGLWPHKWAIPTKTVDAANGIKAYSYQMTDISTSLELGTFCHENGHMLLDYPDYYDYDGDSRGMGSYTLMASYGNSRNPHNIHGYLKYHSGWVDAIELYGAPTQLCSVRVDGDTIYKYTNPNDTQEYFMIENRSKYGWEAGGSLPDQGLFIIHADENGGRDNQEMTEALHYECSVEQADGNFHLENDTNGGDSSDLFHSGGTGPKTTFDDTTTPNAKWWAGADGTAASGTDSGLIIHSISAVGETMTFVYGAGAPAGDPAVGLDANTIDVMTDQGQNAVSETFGVFNSGGGTLSYIISDNQSWLSCSPATGTADTESDLISISFNTSGLSAGSYTSIITVADSSVPTSDTITVNLTVNPQPVLGLSLAAINESSFSGSPGPQVALEIINSGGGTLNYSLSKTQSWLSLTPASGTVLAETDTVYVDLNSSALIPGVYNDTITVTSAEASNSPIDIPVELTVADGPVVELSPTNLALAAYTGEVDNAAIVITNSGGSDLTFSITDNLPSATVYTYKDSDAGDGPTYNWIDISGTGTAETLSDDGESAMINIGFDFPYFESTYSQFQIGANGVVSFISSTSVGTGNGALPNTAIPSQSLAPFWDDLNPAAGGEILYHSTAERLVVSWIAVPHYSGGGPETFQVVIYPDGKIVYQYQTVALGTSCTVGLQDNNTTGPAVQVVNNASYLKNSLAIEFLHPSEPWLTYPVSSGIVPQNTATSIWFYASASNEVPGSYTATVSFAMNDINNQQQDVPIVFIVEDQLQKVLVSETALAATEGGATDTYNLSLRSAPSNDVVVSITPDVELEVDKPQVTFTTGNWDQWQTVTVTAKNDSDHELNHTGTITHSAVSTDTLYDGLAIDSVEVSITDNDNTAPSVTAGQDQFVLLDAGNPGLYFGSVPGDIDEVTPNPETEIVTDISTKTGQNTMPANTTYIFTGKIFDADGQISFTEHIDDKTRIWIDGVLVLSDDAWGTRASTANLDIAPGWHDIEIRISNGTGGSGAQSAPGVGYDPNGGTAWQEIIDPGDGSLLSAGLAPVDVQLAGAASDPDGDPVTTEWSLLAGPTSVSFDNANLTNAIASFSMEGSYTLQLNATDTALQTNDTVIITVTSNAIPAAIPAPSDLSATAIATNEIYISWTDNSTNETGFAIERSLSSGSGYAVIETAPTDATNYTDTGLSAGETYYYRMYATNSTDISATTVVVSATTPKMPATVSLTDLSQAYDGTARSVGVTTEPAGLTVDITYGGNAWAPTNAGSYAVEATINEASYEGMTNGTLQITQAETTVNTWPTAATISDGDALSSAALSGGDASVAGDFSYDTPATTPPPGVYTADITFTPSNANYQSVGGTVSVDVAPAAPTGLNHTPMVGQLDFTWSASSGASSYNVKRALVPGGPYSTIGSPTTTVYSDMTITNGATYYYVASAVGDGGEGPDSSELAATLPQILPFSETFDGGGMSSTLGGLSGQRGWTGGTNAQVQAGIGRSGNGLSIATDTAMIDFANGTNTLVFDFWSKPVAGAEPAGTNIASNATAVIWVDVDNNFAVYSNTTIVTLPVQAPSNAWIHFEVQVDYGNDLWDLTVNGTNIASGLGTYSSQSKFTGIELSNTSPEAAFFDDLMITGPASLTDYDNWLMDNYGTTSMDGNTVASNGVNTIYETYIMGLDPNDTNAFFLVSNIGSQADTMEISWNSVSGRVYNVYWSSNLLSGDGFILLQSNIPWSVGGSFTDAVHGAESKGYYRIGVQLEE